MEHINLSCNVKNMNLLSNVKCLIKYVCIALSQGLTFQKIKTNKEYFH